MAQVIHPSRRVTCIEHSLFFEDVSCPGAGYGFTCSPKGDVLPPENPVAAQSLARVLGEDRHLYHAPVVQEFTRTVRFGVTVQCTCGTHVHCDDVYGNGCHGCDREYNSSGQQLAPRSQWGEEWVTQPEEDYGLY